MKCCNCAAPMTDWTLGSRLGAQIAIDVCGPCQAFWFDQHEDLRLSPASTLELMKYKRTPGAPALLLGMRYWFRRF